MRVFVVVFGWWCVGLVCWCAAMSCVWEEVGRSLYILLVFLAVLDLASYLFILSLFLAACLLL